MSSAGIILGVEQWFTLSGKAAAAAPAEAVRGDHCGMHHAHTRGTHMRTEICGVVALAVFEPV